MTGCLFCQDGHRVIAESENFYVRFDNFPASPGHVQVVPRRHVISLFDLSPTEVAEAMELLRQAHAMIDEEFHPDGYTVGVNEGRAAGRSVDHLHIHLIPRRWGDVPDPRGGIRRVAPNCDPDAWGAERSHG